MVQLLKSVTRDTSGSTFVEYALIATLIGLGIMGSLQVLFNDSVGGLYAGAMTRILTAMGY